MRFLTLIAVLPLLASAYTPPKLLYSRTTCQDGDVVCGSTCIPASFTCCPDLEGGCATASEVCQLGDNDVYGCCPKGQKCSGDGGSQFIDNANDARATVTTTTNLSIQTGSTNAGAMTTVNVAALAIGAIAGLIQLL